MFLRIRSLMLFGGFSMLTALFSLDAFAITVTLAEVEFEGEDDFAVVMGRKAASNGELYWIDEDAYVYEHVGTASRNGKFSFRSGHVPDDCEGTLSVVVSEIEVSVITVPLDFCSSGGGEPPPPPPPEPAVELTLVAKQLDAHGGTDVRGVGFRVDREGPIRVVSGGEDADLRSWTLDLNELSVQNLNHTIYDLESSYDGSIVLTGEGGWNGGTDTDTFRISDEFGLLTGTRAPIGYVYCVALSRNAQWAVASGFYGDILVYETSGLELYASKSTRKKRTKALEFSPDGTVLASTSTAGKIQLWSFPPDCSLDSCELESVPVSMSHSGSWVFPIAFAPYSDGDVTQIVSGSDSGKVKLWTIENLAGLNPNVLPVLEVETGSVYALDWSPEGDKIVAAGNGSITVYDAGTLDIIFHIENAHDGRINDVAFSPDGSLIVSGGDDGALKLWEFGTGSDSVGGQ